MKRNELSVREPNLSDLPSDGAVAAPSSEAPLPGFAGWFIHPRITETTQRQRLHVFVMAHFVGTIFGLLLLAGLYSAAPEVSVDLHWLVPAILGFIALPFFVRLTGRLDIAGTISAQYFAVLVLLISHEYGGLVSPVLVWMVMALGTAIYYLGPWPGWRNANLIMQSILLAIFIVLHAGGMQPGLNIDPHALLVVGIVSSCAVVAFMSFIALQIWAMDLAKQHELEHEMSVRRTVEAEQIRIAEELRRGRDHLALSQRVGKLGSAEIVYWPEHVAHWSDAMFALFGVDPAHKSLSGNEFMSRVHPDDRRVVENYRERESRGDYPRSSEFRVYVTDSAWRWIRRQAEPIEWRQGMPYRVVATYQDVTDEKESQQAVVDLEEQLSQAHKMEAIGQLTGGVAHDFNNLLGVLLGRLQMIDEELVDPKLGDTTQIRNWVRSCIRAVDRGATLTKSMLAFSRQQALAPVILDVNAVIADMEDMLRRSLGEAYRLEVVKSFNLWRTEADAGQLQNALLNLILNSRDATPDGGALKIETRNRTIGSDYVIHHMDVEVGDYVELAISDQGTGMSPETIRRAFEPFFTTKEVGKGSGLGLSMVYGFVKQSGGHVAIESEMGRGTTVRVYLPRKDKDAPATAVENTHIERAVSRGQSEIILIVEDNEELLDVTRKQVERMGYTVLQANTAADGLRVLRQNPEIRLLLSDIVLPHGMNGVEMAESAMNLQPGLKVVFMSGYNDEHEAIKRIQGRFQVSLLQKPFQPSELAARLRAALSSEPHKAI
ncbi:MAG TPA: ATP-binding protein [Magnetospirillaceae bacterium]|jgi:PAS domain S-box-containing protein